MFSMGGWEGAAGRHQCTDCMFSTAVCPLEKGRGHSGQFTADPERIFLLVY